MSNVTPANVTAKRAPDFTETGEYLVSGLTEKPLRIFRDALQFSYPVWYLVDAKDVGFQPLGFQVLGFTKAEALSRLVELFGAEKAS